MSREVQPGMYVGLSDRVLVDDPAEDGGAFGLVGDPPAVGSFLVLRARSGIGVYAPADMRPVPRDEVPPEELHDLDVRSAR